VNLRGRGSRRPDALFVKAGIQDRAESSKEALRREAEEMKSD